jgi:hypothetical protein
MSVAIDSTIVWCESKESRANAAGEKLQKPRDGVADMHIVNDEGPQRLYSAILQVQRDSHVVFPGTKCECLKKWS